MRLSTIVGGRFLLALLMVFTGSVSFAQEGEDPVDFDGAFITPWTTEAVTSIELNPENRIPRVLPGDPIFSEDYLTWDGWPIRDKDDGEVTVFPGGYVVYIAMSAPRTAEDAGGGGNIAQWRYWYTDGEEWTPGGLVFGDSEPFGGRQWAGSARYDDETGRVDFYYTAVGNFPEGADPVLPDEFPQGNPNAGRPPLTQQMAYTSADIDVQDGQVTFSDFSPHEVILTADGEFYQTHGESVTDQVIYGFRDPFYYMDQNTGEEFILFTANAAYDPGPHNGVVGLARKNDEGKWDLLPPIIQAMGVSSQLERPHVVERDGFKYIFFTTHGFTFNPEDAGPEGLYGFAAETDSIRGNYRPLNGTGLVAGNPEEAPNQTYSYLVLPDGSVMSYINDSPASDFLAVPSPIFNINIDGYETSVDAALTDVGNANPTPGGGTVDQPEGQPTDQPAEEGEAPTGASGEEPEEEEAPTGASGEEPEEEEAPTGASGEEPEEGNSSSNALTDRGTSILKRVLNRLGL